MEIAVYSFGRFDILTDADIVFDLFQQINDDLFIDRLYRRYVRREDNARTLELLMDRSKKIQNNLLDQLVEKFEKGIKKSELSYTTFGDYFQIRLAIVDMPYSLIVDDIPLEDYDNLEGDPLWMRPEYMLEKYGGS